MKYEKNVKPPILLTAITAFSLYVGGVPPKNAARNYPKIHLFTNCSHTYGDKYKNKGSLRTRSVT